MFIPLGLTASWMSLALVVAGQPTFGRPIHRPARFAFFSFFERPIISYVFLIGVCPPRIMNIRSASSRRAAQIRAGACRSGHRNCRSLEPNALPCPSSALSRHDEMAIADVNKGVLHRLKGLPPPQSV